MIAPKIKEIITSPGASAIRKMFEQGKILKAKYGEDKVFDFSLGNPDLDPPKEVLDAIEEIANEAIRQKTGARGLRSIVEKLLNETMYEIPSIPGHKKLVINKEMVQAKGKIDLDKYLEVEEKQAISS